MIPLIIPYKLYRGSLAPLIPVKFNKVPIPIDSAIDTGSSTILINRDFANYLNLKLNNNWRVDSSASGTLKTSSATIDLIIGNQEFIDINIRVSEKINFPELPLIGRYPLFNRFNIFLNNVENQCHLIPK